MHAIIVKLIYWQVEVDRKCLGGGKTHTCFSLRENAQRVSCIQKGENRHEDIIPNRELMPTSEKMSQAASQSLKQWKPYSSLFKHLCGKLPFANHLRLLDTMISKACSLRRTCAVFVVGIARQQVRPFHLLPERSRSTWSIQSSTSRFSTFQAPEPPQSKGPAVFNDIDLSLGKDESLKRNSDPSAVFVVTGASRGIGLQFVKSLIERTAGTVVALCRSPETAHGLTAAIVSLNDHDKNRVKVLELDLEDQSSIDNVVTGIKDSFDRVDLLLNVAGILGDGKETPGPERSIDKIEKDWMVKTLNVNLVAPVMLSQGLVPLMEQKRRRGKDSGSASRPNAIIANLSARVGSISDNGLGGWYSYRISKSGLNQATRTMAHELRRKSVWSIALHPGTTNTDLSKPFQKNVQEGRLFPVEFTVDSLLGVIDSMGEENSGGLYDWAGKAIPF